MVNTHDSVAVEANKTTIQCLPVFFPILLRLVYVHLSDLRFLFFVSRWTQPPFANGSAGSPQHNTLKRKAD